MKPKGGETLSVVVNAEFLSLCEVGNYIKTPKRHYKNLSWWLHVYPNGDSRANEGYVGVAIFTSGGGFDVEYCLTIDGTNVKVDEKYSSKIEPVKRDFPRFVTHEELRLAHAVEDGEFTIRCKTKFVRTTSQTTSEPPNTIEESCIIQLNQNDLGMVKLGQTVLTDKQTMDGTTWYHDVFPCGYREDDGGYVSLFLNLEGEPKTLEISYALSVGGVLIYKTFIHIFREKVGKLDFTKLVSHKLCKRADQVNGVSELMCIIVFDQNVPSKLPKYVSNYSHRHDLLEKTLSDNDASSDSSSSSNGSYIGTFKWKDNENLVVNTNLLRLEPGYYFETAKKPTPDKNIFWWIRCYPNGCREMDKGHVSVFVRTSLNMFNILYTLTVDRSNIESILFVGFEIGALDDGSSKLVSHKQIQDDELDHNGTIVIRCHVNFEFSEEEVIPRWKKSGEVPYVEESTVIKLDLKKIKSGGEWVGDEKYYFECREYRYFKGSIKCRSFSDTDKEKGYISVCFITGKRGSDHEISFGMFIGGLLIQKTTYSKRSIGPSDYEKLFLHDQLLLPDQEDGTVDLVCTIKFDIELNLPYPLCWSSKLFQDFCMFQIQEDQLLNGFEKLTSRLYRHDRGGQWRILCFPNGDTEEAKGHISVTVEASAAKTKFRMYGVIKIFGTNFNKWFYLLVPKDDKATFSKLISHKNLRKIGGIINGKVEIICKITCLFYDNRHNKVRRARSSCAVS